jgi:hypothetical protein
MSELKNCEMIWNPKRTRQKASVHEVIFIDYITLTSQTDRMGSTDTGALVLLKTGEFKRAKLMELRMVRSEWPIAIQDWLSSEEVKPRLDKLDLS